MKNKIIISFSLLIIAFSCVYSPKDNFKIKTKERDFHIQRFDQDIFALDTNDISKGLPLLEEKYASFFTTYTRDIMRIGTIDSSFFIPTFKLFLTDSIFREVYENSLSTFGDDISDIERKIDIAFQYIQHYFPKKKLPQVYFHVSGFNQQVVVTEDVLSLSIDNYLGKDYPYYKDLVFDYQLQGMTREKSASDLIMAWLMSEFPISIYTDRILDNIIYRGKIMFLLEVFMPTEKEETLMTYTKDELKWCYQHEKQMWISMVEQKHLFANDRMIAAKYINEAPFTSFFTQDSPGRTGIWIGWQIVRAYMKNNQDVSLKDLMKNENYQKILEDSRYNP